MRREPVIIINATVALIEAAIILLVSLDILQLSEGDTLKVMAAVLALAEFVKTLLVRKKVTPVADPRDDLGRMLGPEQE